MPTKSIDLSDELNRWRYRCPVGHVGWHLRSDHTYCQACHARFGKQSQCRHSVIVDEATDEPIPHDRIESKTDRVLKLEEPEAVTSRE
jgi:hypothetical protein